MESERITKAIEAARLVLDNAHDILRERTHHDHGHFIAANVKLHTLPSVDADSVLRSLDLTDLQRAKVEAAIGDMLDERNMREHETVWLEDECRYAMDFLGGCTVCSPDHWQEVHNKIDAGYPTNYPYIDDIEGYEAEQTVRLKHYECERMAEFDRTLARALDRVHQPHFAGRSGGWLHLLPDWKLQGYMEDVEEKLLDLDTAMTNDYSTFDEDEIAVACFEAVDEALDQLAQSVEELDQFIEDIHRLLGEIANLKAGLNFGEFMKDRVMQRIEDERIGVRTLLEVSE